MNVPRLQPCFRWLTSAKIDWGTILLFGTGIIFGALLSSTGLAETIGNAAADNLGVTSIALSEGGVRLRPLVVANPARQGFADTRQLAVRRPYFAFGWRVGKENEADQARISHNAVAQHETRGRREMEFLTRSMAEPLNCR